MADGEFATISFQSNTQNMFSQTLYSGPRAFKNILACQTVKNLGHGPDRNALKRALIRERERREDESFPSGPVGRRNRRLSKLRLQVLLVCAG